MDSVAAAVLVCAPDGTIVDLNRMAAELLDVDPVSALGTALREVRAVGGHVGGRGRRRRSDRQSRPSLAWRSRDSRCEGEVVGLLGDGSGPPSWLRISAEPLLSPSGELEDVVITLVDITGLKETRDALREVVAELNDLVETLPDTYVYVDAGDVVRRVTGARASRSGRTRRADRRGRRRRRSGRRCPRTRRRRLRKAAALARTTGKPVTTEIATVTPTAIRYDEVRQVPRDGGTLLFIVRDITESRRAAEALRQSEEKYRTLYLRTPVMLHSIDAEGRLLSVSDRWLQRLGYSADEVLGRPVTEFMTDESRRFAREEGFPTFLATGSLDDVPIQFVARGRLCDRRAAVRDLRARRRRLPAALSLGAGRRDRAAARACAPWPSRTGRLQTLLANVPGMAYRCANDRAWSTQILSDGCRDLTGYTPEELIGDEGPAYADIIVAEDRDPVWDAIQAALRDDAPWTITYRIVTREGETRWVWERGIGVRDDEGQLSSTSKGSSATSPGCGRPSRRCASASRCSAAS